MTTISVPRWIAGSRASAASVFLGLAVGLSLLPSPIPYVLAGAIAVVSAPSLRLRVLVIATVATVGWTPWPVPALIGVCAWWIVARPTTRFLREVRSAHARSVWWQVPTAVLLGLVTVAVAWDRIGGDASPLMPFPRPDVTTMLAIVAGLAALNAVAEEALWRIALLAEQSSDRPLIVSGAQALSFGIAHWAGLPYGIVGVIASGLFSLALFFLRNRFGLVNTVIVHWVVDIVIFAAVFTFAIYPPT